VFDAVLVATSVIDELLTTQVDLSHVRMLRVFRMASVLRIIRIIETFRELREMLCAVIASVKSIFWAFVLLCSIMYLFSILSMQFALNAIEQDGAPTNEFQERWGSVASAMFFSLLAAISGSFDWVSIVSVFDKYCDWYRIYFSMFIVLVTVGMLNVLTGVFVARSAEVSVLDKDLIIQAEIANTRSKVRDLKYLFEEMDREHHGSVDVEQLIDYMSQSDVQAYLATLQLHTSNFKAVASMLDPHKTGQVSMDAFIAGCLRYKGHARTVDVAMLMQQQKTQSSNLGNLAKSFEKQMRTLTNQMQF